MIMLKHGISHLAGYWWPIELYDDIWSATCTCPACGRILTLWEQTIENDGIVQPPLKCDHEGCDFDAAIQLENWIK